ncbi:tRNA-splicing endonuclease subunit [Gonapodya sp. JEL0774]|nr:tRNA-splicing endonuclease subunit [Gonapodya sp. JEL0774]
MSRRTFDDMAMDDAQFEELIDDDDVMDFEGSDGPPSASAVVYGAGASGSGFAHGGHGKRGGGQDEKIVIVDTDFFNNVAHLRASHRIIGALIGALHRFPQQTTYTGLPLLLGREEVMCCLTKGYAHIIPYSPSHYRDPTETDLKLFETLREDKSREYAETLETSKRMKAKSNVNTERVGGKARRDRGRTSEAGIIDSSGMSTEAPTHEEETPAESMLFGTESLAASSPRYTTATKRVDLAFTYVPTSSTSLSWYSPGTTPDDARKLWNYLFPSLAVRPTIVLGENEERTGVDADSYSAASANLRRMAVFRDLHEKGHYMTNGAKFGGEFLVYYGNPSRFHSHFITTILPTSPTPTTLMPLPSLVSSSRVGTTVKKSRLICSTSVGWNTQQWDELRGAVDGGMEMRELVEAMERNWLADGRREVVYWSVEWTGWS